MKDDGQTAALQLKGEGSGEGREYPCEEWWKRCMEFHRRGVVAALSRLPGAKYEVKVSEERRMIDIVARTEECGQKAVVEALLAAARAQGLSIAIPECGKLPGTPEKEGRREGVLLRLRRPRLMDDLQRQGKWQFFSLLRTEKEVFYVVVEGYHSYGKPKAERATSFREHLTRVLWPGERIIPFQGRLVVEGPGGAYRFHFNWEGNGKHARFTADFREPECPIVELGRSSIRMLRRTPSQRSLVEVGMSNPAVVELVPDPAERYTLLHFANRKLRKRLPRALVEELQAAMAAGK